MAKSNSAPILDYIESVRLRDIGMNLAATASSDWLERARVVARHLAAKNGECTINDVYQVVGLPEKRNVAGSVFKSGFRRVGMHESGRPERHAGLVSVWVLV